MDREDAPDGLSPAAGPAAAALRRTFSPAHAAQPVRSGQGAAAPRRPTPHRATTSGLARAQPRPLPCACTPHTRRTYLHVQLRCRPVGEPTLSCPAPDNASPRLPTSAGPFAVPAAAPQPPVLPRHPNLPHAAAGVDATATLFWWRRSNPSSGRPRAGRIRNGPVPAHPGPR
jgi:hypothetical protein